MTKSSAGAAGNLGPAGRRQRLVAGLVGLAASSAVLFWLDRTGASRWWRLAMFPLLWMGATGLLQARARTCIALAARGVCDEDAPGGPLTPERDALLRRRARAIVRAATAIAAALTLLALIVP